MKKRTLSLLLAAAMTFSLLTTGALAVSGNTISGDNYTLDFGAHAVTEETITYETYDVMKQEVVRVSETVKAVHMNVGDTFTVEYDPSMIELSGSIAMWNSYPNGTRFNGMYPEKNLPRSDGGNIQQVVIPDPRDGGQFDASIGDISQCKFMIPYNLDWTPKSEHFNGWEESIVTFYVMVDNVGTNGQPTTTEQPPAPVVTPPAEQGTTATPTTPTTPATPAAQGDITYTVQYGDTLANIALNNYGSYSYSNKLYKANSAAFKESKGILLAGMVLTLPEKLGNATRLAPQALAEGESFYTVKAGDSLSKIALKTYCDMMEYKAIYQRNADRIKSANTILCGAGHYSPRESGSAHASRARMILPQT